VFPIRPPFFMVEKRLGQRRPELIDELYQTRLSNAGAVALQRLGSVRSGSSQRVLRRRQIVQVTCDGPAILH
jgi:hypothetical protein